MLTFEDRFFSAFHCFGEQIFLRFLKNFKFWTQIVFKFLPPVCCSRQNLLQMCFITIVNRYRQKQRKIMKESSHKSLRKPFQNFVTPMVFLAATCRADTKRLWHWVWHEWIDIFKKTMLTRWQMVIASWFWDALILLWAHAECYHTPFVCSVNRNFQRKNFLLSFDSIT